jgi:hypothetical protein
MKVCKLAAWIHTVENLHVQDGGIVLTTRANGGDGRVGVYRFEPAAGAGRFIVEGVSAAAK